MNKDKLSEKNIERVVNITSAIFLLMLFAILMVFIFPLEQMLLARMTIIITVITGITFIIKGICYHLKWGSKRQLVESLVIAGIMFFLPITLLLV